MRLRLASYNIQKAVGLDLRRDPARVLEVINALEADVVALQEADLRLGPRPAALPRRLIEHESDFEVAEVAENEVSLGWHGNAILVRRGLHVAGVARLPLPGLEPRGAVRVDIAGAGGGISVIGAHLGLLRTWRRRQARALARHAARAGAGAGLRTVILGDFNEWSECAGLEPLAERFLLVAPGRTFHAARPIAALDRAALDPRLRLVGAGVAQSPRARISSDHLPIWVDAEI